MKKYRQRFPGIDPLENAAAPRWRSFVWRRKCLPRKTLFLVPRGQPEHFGLHESAGHTCVLKQGFQKNTLLELARFYFPQ